MLSRMVPQAVWRMRKRPTPRWTSPRTERPRSPPSLLMTRTEMPSVGLWAVPTTTCSPSMTACWPSASLPTTRTRGLRHRGVSAVGEERVQGDCQGRRRHTRGGRDGDGRGRGGNGEHRQAAAAGIPAALGPACRTRTRWCRAKGGSGRGRKTGRRGRDIEGATSPRRSPAQADEGMYLRAAVTYSDKFGAGKTASAVSARPCGGEDAVQCRSLLRRPG